MTEWLLSPWFCKSGYYSVHECICVYCGILFHVWKRNVLYACHCYHLNKLFVMGHVIILRDPWQIITVSLDRMKWGHSNLAYIDKIEEITSLSTASQLTMSEHHRDIILYCYLAASAIMVIIIFVTLCTLFGFFFLFCLFCLVFVYIVLYYYCMLPLEVNKVVQYSRILNLVGHDTSSECSAAAAWTSPRCKPSSGLSFTAKLLSAKRPAPGEASRRRMTDIASKPSSVVVESGLVSIRETSQRHRSSWRTHCPAAWWAANSTCMLYGLLSDQSDTDYQSPSSRPRRQSITFL